MKHQPSIQKSNLSASNAKKENITKEQQIAAEIAGIEDEITLIRMCQLTIEYKLNRIKILNKT